MMLSKEQLLQTVMMGHEEISALLKVSSTEEIIAAAADIFEVDRDRMAGHPMDELFGREAEVPYGYAVDELIRHIEGYDRLYRELEDKSSKETLEELIRYQILPDGAFLKKAAGKAGPPREDNGGGAASEDGLLWLDGVDGILEMKERIGDEKPLLAFHPYDRVNDIWVIPGLLRMVCPDYRYRLCCHAKAQSVEIALYAALPKKRAPKKIRTVVAMAPYERPWSNVELVKDCGSIPYLLYKNHGCEVSMVGAKGGAYPYADLVKGMRLESLQDGKAKTKEQYLMAHGKEIDCLILRGCYDDNYGLAKVYKRVNPEGRIYVGLDANGRWMDRIRWDEKRFTDFMDRCDVAGASCTAMQEYLNEKWPWHIECIPNGYYDFEPDGVECVSFAEKEQVILTVGRLGTVQKATDMLLEAFAEIADELPDWKLRLVGSVEEAFQDEIDGFFERYPGLRDRVIFTGPIMDRSKLREEYRKAKVFALPSTWEGGAPNVIAEALNAGCVMALTKIDAYADAIDGGACGDAVDIGDMRGFAELLLALCKNPALEQMSDHALAYGRDFYNMEKIVGGLYEQLCV